MDNLEIFDLYEKNKNSKAESFSSSLNSSLSVSNKYNKVECDIEWLEMMEKTVRYIDNILRNPNRFIVNEEDIVKIEMARRVTVESIKHLSRNTNLIQKIEDNGDVKPSKILNINKEESYNTYENRFIYSLIQNMRMFIDRKKSNGIVESSVKSNKKLEYSGNSVVNGEKVNISVNLETNLDKKNKHKNDDKLDLGQRIERLELNISDLTNAEVYQAIHKLRVSLVTSPIKKTNVILKNANFQQALILWNYMQNNIEDKTKIENKNESYKDDDVLKKYIDETFLINYLVADTINKEEIDEEERKEISKNIADNLITRLIELNPNMSDSEVKDMLGEAYAVVKNKILVNDSQVRKIFKDKVAKYLKNINNFKL